MSTGDNCANDDDVGQEGVPSIPPPPMAQQPLLGQGYLIIEDSRSHSVGLPWTNDQPVTKTST